MKSHAKITEETSPETPLSALGKCWMLPDPANTALGGKIAQHIGLPPLIGQLLANRAINYEADGAEGVYQFLNPTLKTLPAPETLYDIEKATARLIKALKSQEKIAILGDYDVDGACSAALALRYFRALGLAPILYVPDRLKEGYGPNKTAMQTLKAQGVTLVITVDCGIQAHEALEEAKNIGLEVLITDHHQQGDSVPPCVACVNPNQKADISELSMLCGTGVIFYVFMALNRALRTEKFFTDTTPEPDLRKWLDLVALATVCDIMPLVGANRVLVAKGLQVMAQWQNEGLKSLSALAEVKEVGTYACGFQLGPRINAAGRVDDCQLGAELLATQNPKTAQELAEKAHLCNEKRRAIEKDNLAEAMVLAEKQVDEGAKAIAIAHPEWHPGVIGIVAARVKEKFHRPTFVFSIGADGVVKGSGRSIPAVDMGAAILDNEAYIINGGGHFMAGGVSVKEARLPQFIKAFQAHVAEQTAKNLDAFTPEIAIDATLPIESVSLPLLDSLQSLAPYGSKNPEPVVLFEGIFVAFLKRIGKEGTHLKLSLRSQTGATLSAIAFSATDTLLEEVFKRAKTGEKIDIIGQLRHNTWQGVTRPDFLIKDARMSTPE